MSLTENKPVPGSSGNAVPGRTSRRFPSKLACHLLAEFIVPLLGSVGAFALLSLLVAVFDRLQDFTGSGIPVWRLCIYFAACMPETLIIVFPVSALLAICWMTTVLGKNSELTAIRSAGVSLLAAATHIWIIAAAMCLFAAILSEVLQPLSIEFTEATEEKYINDSNEDTDHSLAYTNQKAGREWFFARFNVSEPSRGIVLRLRGKDGRTEKTITAESGEYMPVEHGWVFRNGDVVDYRYDDVDAGLAYQEQPRPFEVLMQPCDDRPKDIQLQSRSTEQMPLPELFQMRQNASRSLSKKTRRLVDTMIAYRICSPFATFIAILFGFAMTITTGRKGVVQGLVAAVALYVFYYAASQFFLVMGKNGSMNPWLAGILPTATALIASIHLAWRKQ